MSKKVTRIALVTVDIIEAVSAFVGAVGLVVGFMNIPTTVLSGTPFADFTVPALLLGFVVGGSALVAALTAVFAPIPRASVTTQTSMNVGCLMRLRNP